MKCKFASAATSLVASTRFNRNIVECKYNRLAFDDSKEARFNRNIVECKYELKELKEYANKDLIET